MSMLDDIMNMIRNDDDLSPADKEKLFRELDELAVTEFGGNRDEAVKAIIVRFVHKKMQMSMVVQMMNLLGELASTDFKIKVLLGGIGRHRPSESIAAASKREHYDQFVAAAKEGVLAGFQELVEKIDNVGSGGESGIEPVQVFTRASIKELSHIFVRLLVACGSQYKPKEEVLQHYMKKEVAEGLIGDMKSVINGMFDTSRKMEEDIIRIEDDIKRAARENGVDEGEIFGIFG